VAFVDHRSDKLVDLTLPSWPSSLPHLTLPKVQHTYPLTLPQKQSFAKAITHLHSTFFLTPSLFVNVSFHRLAPDNGDNTYFLAGEPMAHNAAGPNRILAQVRTSPKRTKAIFDDLAEKIERKWYEIVNEPTYVLFAFAPGR
jgi:phenylpyruvate tautomerase PptA (4-oxalocrotonate tautomerase family)